MSTTSVKSQILTSLKADPEYRHAWNLENVYTGVCFQIRALREQRNLSQAELGQRAHMAQERISILEDPNAKTKPTLTTLLRIADAYDVGLDVRFVPYKTVLERSVSTDLKGLEVPSFTEELPELERDIPSEQGAQHAEKVAARAYAQAIALNTKAAKETTVSQSYAYTVKPSLKPLGQPVPAVSPHSIAHICNSNANRNHRSHTSRRRRASSEHRLNRRRAA